LFSTFLTTEWIRSSALVVAVLMLVPTVAFGPASDAFGQASDADSPTDSSSKTESRESDPGTDQVAVKSFRKPPMEPAKIASVFRAQAVMPEDVSPVEPERSEDQLNSDPSDPGNQSEGSDDEPLKQNKIAELISQLGAPEFAVREQATAGLRKLADDALPALRTAAIEHDDLEVRLRAEDVATGIVNSAVAGRIDSFLEGQPGSFEGWEVFQQVLGDGPRLREVFVEMMLRHQDLVQALEVSTGARMAALEKVIARVQRRQLIESQLPSAADVIAMLLCFNDPDLRLSNIHEESLLRMLRMSVTTEVLRDDQLAEPFRVLLAGWIPRCNQASRPEVLWMSLQREFKRSLPLAEKVLQQPGSGIDEVAFSLQLISRFGDESNVGLVREFLKDERPVTDLNFIGGNQIQTQVRDLAAATIMILKDKPLDEIGLNPNSRHPKVGLVAGNLGFPVDDPEPRRKMLDALDELLESDTDPAVDTTDKTDSD